MQLRDFAEELIQNGADEANQLDEVSEPQEEVTEVTEELDQPSEAEEEDILEEDTEIEDPEVEESEDSDAPWMPEDLDDLAAALGVEPDELSSIRVRTKVDGVEGKATLGEVIKNYQINKSLTERSEAFAHERKAFEENSTKFQQEYETKLEEVESLVEVMEDNLKADLVNIDWDTLEREDPGRYAATRQKVMEKIGMLEQAKQNVLEKREKARQKAMEEYSKRHAEILEYNRQELLKAIPEFSDQSKMKEGVTKIKDYLRTSVGVSDQELETITDYRMVVLAQKAMAYDEMKNKAQPVKAKAKSKPKFSKPSARKSNAQVAQDQIAKRAKRLKSTGKAKDFAALLLESGNF